MKNMNLLIGAGVVIAFIWAINKWIKSNFIPKLYFGFLEYGQSLNNYISENKLEKIVMINDAQFLGKDHYTYDPQLLIKEIERVLPNANDKGICFIDLEGENLENIMNLDIQSESFKKSLTLFLDVIKFCKKFRPNVKWGYYAIPYTTYWNRNAEFYNKIQKIKPLLYECDIFFPSLYTFYEDKELALENEKYVIENTIEMIKLGQLYNKPVLVFVWHRYHSSNEKLSEESLPENVFLTQIDRIVNTTYKGKKVDGLIWWGADDYAFRQKTKGVLKEFDGNDKDFKIFNDKVLVDKSIKINERQDK
jgi:hypothetical protein